jgi:hypothetical protein
MMDREQLLDRIQKLLNMTVANGATEAEAEAAMAAARRLMDAHNIAMAEAISRDETAVELDPEAGVELDPETEWEGRSASAVHEAALAVVASVFGVRRAAVRHQVVPAGMGTSGRHGPRRKTGVKIVLVGDPTDLEAARWAFRFLVATFHRLWRAAYRNQDREAHRGYIAGLRDGFTAKLKRERAGREGARGGPAYAPIRPPSGLDWGAYNHGYRDGAEFPMPRPIDKAAPKEFEGSRRRLPGGN